MAINFFFEDIEENTEYQIGIEKWLQKVAKEEGKRIEELNYIFCSDNYLLDINKKYLNHDYFTDIITFDNSDNENVKSDIFISIHTVEQNAKDYSVSFVNELRRVIVHGLLHLLDYNDKTEDEQKEMTKKEDYYLEKY